MSWFDPPRDQLSDVQVVLSYYPDDDEAHMSWVPGVMAARTVEVDDVHLCYDEDDRLIGVGVEGAMRRLPPDVLANAMVYIEDGQD